MERWFDEVEMNTVPGVAMYLVSTLPRMPAYRLVHLIDPNKGRI